MDNAPTKGCSKKMLFEPNDEKQTFEAQKEGPQTQGPTAAKALEKQHCIEARAKSSGEKSVVKMVPWVTRRGRVIPNILGRLGLQALPASALKASCALASKKVVQGIRVAGRTEKRGGEAAETS